MRTLLTIIKSNELFILHCYNMQNNKDNNMSNSKITVTIPQEMASQLMAIKDEFKISMSAIYKEALGYYLERKEIEKWERGAKLATQDKQYMEFVNDCRDEKGDLYEY